MTEVSAAERNLALARRYLEALERRDDPAAIAAFMHPDIVQEEFPNRLVPQGARRDLAALREGMERGRQVVSSERYEIVGEVTEGDRVALEVRWSGTLAVAFGEMLPAGSVLRARFAVFLEFRDGLIVAQRNYDCFEPW